MKRHEYWKSASDAFRDGRVDEEEDEEDPVEFVRDLFLSFPMTPEHMTVEEAQADLAHFALEGRKIPSDMDADTYADLWNQLVEEMNEDEL